MDVKEFDYELPQELIAQMPCKTRGASRMLVMDKYTGEVFHNHFFDIVDLLNEDDVLILNDTKVIPARLLGHKENNTPIEVFLLKNIEGKNWECLLKPAKRAKDGTIIKFSDDLSAKVINRLEEGKILVELIYDGDFYSILDKVGLTPLPPYIERKMTNDEIKNLDCSRYQTVYANVLGSVAAPTAGLHFSEEIL